MPCTDFSVPWVRIPPCPLMVEGVWLGTVRQTTRSRAVAQLGSAPYWGCGGRRFKSCQPDLKPTPSHRDGVGSFLRSRSGAEVFHRVIAGVSDSWHPWHRNQRRRPGGSMVPGDRCREDFSVRRRPRIKLDSGGAASHASQGMQAESRKGFRRVDIIEAMLLRPSSLLTVLQIVAPSLFARGAGRIRCVRRSDFGARAKAIETTVITEASDTTFDGGCSHHREAPAATAGDESDCGCHPRFPIAGRNEPIRTVCGVDLMRLARWSASIRMSLGSLGPLVPPVLRDGDSDPRLRSEQFRARPIMSLRVS